MVPNNSTKFEIRSQVISGNHWGRTDRNGRTHTHQTKRRVSHNTSPLSVEGYTKPPAELEINVDVKYVGEGRTNGRIKGRVGTVWGKWERGKDFGKWVTCGKY
jgi:hypothetical protein